MLRRTVATLAAVLILPLAARAQDREWEEDDSGQWSGQQPPDAYGDVSVDLNVSGAVDLGSFQGSLQPYGDWVTTGGYGTVWRPRVAAGWRPYYYGRWEWTNEGWLWVSDEPFGWATYHYGRWTYDSAYGWVWIPGYQWAPAWVAWRTSGDAIGWAPLGPGVSVYVSSYPFVDVWWTFVPTVQFCSVPVYQVAYAPTYTRRWFYQTAPAPARPLVRPAPGRGVAPAPAWGGPAPRFVEQRMGRAIAPVRVTAAPAPGAARWSPGEVSIYRPEARPAPGARGGRWDGTPGRAPGGFAPAPLGDRNGFGRGPGAAPAPGRGEAGAAPSPQRNDGRGPGAVAPPGRGGDAGGWGTPHGAGRGPGAVPAPGRAPEPGGYEQRTVAPAPRGNGGGYVAPPAPRGNGGGYVAPAVPRGNGGGYVAPPAPRGNGGGYVAPAAPRGNGGGYVAPAAPGGNGGGWSPPRAERAPVAAPAPQQHGGYAPAPPQSQGGGGNRPAPAPAPAQGGRQRER